MKGYSEIIIKTGHEDCANDCESFHPIKTHKDGHIQWECRHRKACEHAAWDLCNKIKEEWTPEEWAMCPRCEKLTPIVGNYCMYCGLPESEMRDYKSITGQYENRNT